MRILLPQFRMPGNHNERFVLQRAGKNHPVIALVHAYPRVVKTGLNEDTDFVIRTATNPTFKTLITLDAQYLKER